MCSISIPLNVIDQIQNFAPKELAFKPLNLSDTIENELVLWSVDPSLVANQAMPVCVELDQNIKESHINRLSNSINGELQQ